MSHNDSKDEETGRLLKPADSNDSKESDKLKDKKITSKEGYDEYEENDDIELDDHLW